MRTLQNTNHADSILMIRILQAREDKERQQKSAEFAKNNPNARWNPFAQKEGHGAEEARWQMQQWGFGGRTQDDVAREEAERLRLEREREPSWWNPFEWKSNATGVNDTPKATETSNKHWYDFMPAHQDRTRQTKTAMLKAAMTGKDADLAKAAAHHKVCVHESKQLTTRMQAKSIGCVAAFSLYTYFIPSPSFSFPLLLLPSIPPPLSGTYRWPKQTSRYTTCSTEKKRKRTIGGTLERELALTNNVPSLVREK